MLLQELKLRLRTEYNAYRLSLVTGKLTSEELLNKAYELTWKEEIVCLFEGLPDGNRRYSDDLLCWILKQPNALGFMYEVWLHTDYLLTSEFADLLYDELRVRKDGMNE